LERDWTAITGTIMSLACVVTLAIGWLGEVLPYIQKFAHEVLK